MVRFISSFFDSLYYSERFKFLICVRDGNDGPWSTFTLGIGTPLQYARVLISTTGYLPWVVQLEGCTSADPSNCASSRGSLFHPNKSTTRQEAGLFELDLELNLGYTGNGDFAFDSVTLGLPGAGAPVLSHQLFAGIATKQFYLATWGMAPRPANLTNFNEPQQSVLSVLKETNQIPSLSYGYTAGAPYRKLACWFSHTP